LTRLAVDNLQVQLQPKQAELYRAMMNDAGPVILGIGGSKGSSKSHGMRACMLLRRIAYPGTAGLIFRRKWKQLRDTHLDGGFFRTWPTLRQFWKISERTLYLPNGSRIVFGYAENPGDIDDFQGHEYMDVMVDEATRLTELELVKLNETRRWTGRVRGKVIADRACKTLLGMNPGGPGHNYIRRLMYKKEYHGHERASDYAFFPAYAWDNIEWCISTLREQGLNRCDYYGCLNEDSKNVVMHGGVCRHSSESHTPKSGMTEEERFKFFITYTQRGHELNNLPQRLRTGWLLGNWDEFAGQFYDIWNPEQYVKRCLPDRDWYPRWLGIDWGFQHPCVCHWMARVGPTTKIYREALSNHHSARAQAQEIVDRTPEEERKQMDAIYLSPDAFQRRSEQDSFADMMGQVFRSNGMPYPTPADDDRQHGAQCMYDLMKSNELEIDPSCTHLIDVIPMITTDEDDPEEIEKFDGDDAWDSARYGLKSRQSARRAPVIETAHQKVIDFAAARNTPIEDMDINSIARLHERALAIEKKKQPKRGGLGPIWPLRRGRGRVWRPCTGTYN